jgi:hypothetical protein
MSNVALLLVSWQDHRQVLVPAPLVANLLDWRVVGIRHKRGIHPGFRISL